MGEPLSLTAFVSDDGRLKPNAAPRGVDSDTTALGLRVAWFVYRGSADKVTFDPEQFKVYIRDEIAANAALVKAAGIKLG